jgi:hypothetical protein
MSRAKAVRLVNWGQWYRTGSLGHPKQLAGVDAYLLPDQSNIPQVSITEGGQISARGEAPKPCGDPLGLLVDGGHGNLTKFATLTGRRPM